LAFDGETIIRIFAAVSRSYPISAGIGADDAGEAPMLGVVNGVRCSQ
jgi:hypothetical protein